MSRKTAIKISIFGVSITFIALIVSIILNKKVDLPILAVMFSNIAILCSNIELLKKEKKEK